MRLHMVVSLSVLVTFSTSVLSADTVLMNGEIYTVNDEQPWVEALAIKNKRIVFAGTDQGAEAYIGPDSNVIDLHGRMAMPGIHDAHQHLMLGGISALGCPVPLGMKGEEYLKALQETLEKCAADLEVNEWLVGSGFFSEQFPANVPHKKYLDQIFPDRPVYLIERTHHNGLVNSKALELTGVNDSTPDPEGGRIVRDRNGSPTGELIEKATVLVQGFIPPPTPEKYFQAAKRGIEIGHQYGITSLQEAGTSEELLIALKKLEESGELKMNVTAHLIWGQKGQSIDKQLAVITNRAKYQSEHVDPNNIKVVLDGTPTGPYFTQADLDLNTGEPDLENILVSPEKLNETVARFDAIGMKVKMHVAGKGAAHVALDAIAKARMQNPNSSVRHELAHTSLVTLGDMDRMRKLNVVGEMSPAQWQLREPFGDPPEDPWQFRTLSNKGVMLTIGTDWPVTRTPEVFEALEGLLFFDDESLDLRSALRAMTWHGAVAIDRAEDMGTLEPGKLGNVIVLDQNLFAIDPLDISETRVLMTLFEGEVVYERR